MTAGSIVATGTMAELIRQFDWSTTSLGPLANWSETLLAEVNQMLSSKSASTLCWGDDLVLLYNDGAIASMGPVHPAVLGGKARVVFHEAWQVLGPVMDACLRGETQIHENTCFPMNRGGQIEEVYFNFGMIPVYESGKVVGVLGAHENTTEKVLARKRRDAIAVQLEQVLDATSDGVVSLDRDWRITYMNRRAQRILVCDESVLGMNVWKAFPSQAYPNSPCVMHFEHAMYARVASMYQVYYPDPISKFVELEVRPARAGVVAFLRDITDQKLLEQRLEEVETNERIRLLELFERAPAFLAVLAGPDHVFEMANTAYQDMLGQRDLIGKSVVECVPEVRETGWIKILDDVYRTGIAHSERGALLMLATTPGGPLQERYVDYVYQPRRRPDGTVYGIIALGMDVTEQHRAHTALVRNEKLAAVGRLASSIAHEINNPLSAAMNYLYVANVSDELKEVRECVELACAELQRVSVISTQTLLSQKQSVAPSPTSFEEITSGVLELYKGRSKTSGVEIETRHLPARHVVCMEGEIRQVVGNLIGNAIDAMSANGGRLLLRSREATDWKTGRRGNVLTIADTGSGIAPDVIRKIFDPFFTTKGELGNGLGLWITQEIIARHHGELQLRSSTKAPHNGTVFRLFLP